MNRNKALTERIALYASAKVTYPVLFIIFLTTFSISVYQYINFTAEKQSYFVFSGYLSTFCVIIFYFSASYKAEISKLFGWKILRITAVTMLIARILTHATELSPSFNEYIQFDSIYFYIPSYLLVFIALFSLGFSNFHRIEKLKILSHCFNLSICLAFFTNMIVLISNRNDTFDIKFSNVAYLNVIILSLTFSILFYSGFDKLIRPFTFTLVVGVIGDFISLYYPSKIFRIMHPSLDFFMILFYLGILSCVMNPKTSPTTKKIKGENILLICIETLAFICVFSAFVYYLIYRNIPRELFFPLIAIFVTLLFSDYLSYLYNKILLKAKDKSVKEVLKSSERFKVVFENSPTSLILLDLSGDIIHTNQTFTDFCGVDQKQIIGHSIGHIIHPDDRSLFDINLAKVLGSVETNSITLECRFIRVDGEVRWGSTSINHIPSSSFIDEVNADFVIQIEDITNKKIHETELLSMANRDPLTGLWNRTYLSTLITKVLDGNKTFDAIEDGPSREVKQTFAVFFLDLDRFKIINDTLGHNAGDIVLQTTAERITNIVGARGEVARLGGDEFVILFYPPTNQTLIEIIAEEIKVSIAQPILLSQGETIVTCSIGVLMCFGNGLNPSDIMREADVAMYRAKDHGKNFVEIATTKDSVRKYSDMKFTNDLRRALATNQIKAYYQPIISLTTNEIVGFEALSRWEHPRKGLISRDQFIPLAEDTGLILDIGYFMMQEAFRQLSIWQKTYIPSSGKPLTMNVNLSVSQLRDPKLFRQMENVKQQSQCSVNSMIFEITESAVMGDAKRAIALLHEIRDLGFKLRIDDFGTGYSSLSYLKRMPIDGFKIDKSFVDGLDIDENDTAIVHALLGLAHAMKLTVTAEGIELESQRDSLRKLNCDYGQGYLFSKAVPAKDVVLMNNVNFKSVSSDESLDTA